MTHFYENVYMSLRNSMINRELGETNEDAVFIHVGASHIALKREIPSSAVLIAYSMLFYPNWFKDKKSIEICPVGKPIEDFIGGVHNPNFQLLYNPQIAVIASAVGAYAGLLKLHYSKVLGTTMINANMDNPIVKATAQRIHEDKLTFKDARSLFIELMQKEETALTVPLADDYIANATFIADQTIEQGGSTSQDIVSLDLSNEFEGADV